MGRCFEKRGLVFESYNYIINRGQQPNISCCFFFRKWNLERNFRLEYNFQIKNKKRLLLFLVIVLIILAGISYYVFLPALNVGSIGLWIFVILLFVGLGIIQILLGIPDRKFRSGLISMGLGLLLFIVIMGGMFFNSPVFRAKDYAQLIEVEEMNFAEDFVENDTSGIPLMDRDTATRLGDRQIGGVSELVSQFVPASDYIQINIDDVPYRVTPLQYASFFRWVNNRSEGVPGYIRVNMVSGNAEIIDVKEGIKYSDSERFGRNVKRHLRFSYSTAIFGEPSFEVDDEGHPYYVATTYKTRFFFNYKEPTGVITLDAVTGETVRYELDESPQWVDRVYSAELILSQLDDYGKYQDGYWNSLIDQQGVTRTTDGYNYLSIEEDIFMYTGVTSVNSDASNIGFYLVNLRTKEAEYFPVVSADEFSAMESAVGSVQQMRYESTFPILINLEGRPYYLSSLKDDSGLVRLYALVDAQNYQTVYTDSRIDNVIAMMYEDLGIESDLEVVEEIENEEELIAFSGQVSEISQAVVSGDTIYYFMINGEVFKANINLHDDLPFVNEGTVIDGFADEANNIEEITTIERNTSLEE